MTSALHAEGPQFDPGREYLFVPPPKPPPVQRSHPIFTCWSRLAQMVERKTLNLVVVGSSPTVGAFFLEARLPQLPRYRPTCSRSHLSAALAQLGERQTEDLKVPSSILGGGTPLFFIFSPVMLERQLTPSLTHRLPPWPNG